MILKGCGGIFEFNDIVVGLVSRLYLLCRCALIFDFGFFFVFYSKNCIIYY